MPNRDENDRSSRPDQNPLHDRTPAGCWRQPRLKAHLGVQVGGLKEVRAGQLAAVWCDHRTDPGGAGNHDVSVVLYGSDLGEGQLLLTHCLVESGVVAGDGQQLGAVEDRFSRLAIEDHFPAGGYPDRYSGYVHDVATFAGHEMAGTIGIPGKMPKKPWHRQVLAERLHDFLVMAVGRSGDRIPDDHRVGVFGRFLHAAWNVEHGADQDRRADCRGCVLDLLPGVGIDEWIDIRRVLGPDHELRLWGDPRTHVLGQPERLPNVVVQHRSPLRVEVQPESRHIALHSRDGDRRFTTRSGTRLPHMQRDDNGGEQHQAYADTWQHHRRRWRIGSIGCGRLSGRVRGCGAARDAPATGAATCLAAGS